MSWLRYHIFIYSGPGFVSRIWYAIIIWKIFGTDFQSDKKRIIPPLLAITYISRLRKNCENKVTMQYYNICTFYRTNPFNFKEQINIFNWLFAPASPVTFNPYYSTSGGWIKKKLCSSFLCIKCQTKSVQWFCCESVTERLSYFLAFIIWVWKYGFIREK